MKLKKLSRKKIFIISVVLIVAVGAVFAINQNQAKKVDVALVKKGDIAEYVEELAVVLPEDKESVFSMTSGKVSEVLVDVGAEIAEGDILIKIDSEDIARQIKELEAKRTQLMAEYNEAVKAADYREIEKLQLQINVQEKTVNEAKRKMNNIKKLYEEGAVSKEEYQAAVTLFDVENAKLESSKLDLELLKKPPSKNLISQFEAQLKQLDIQMENLKSKGEDFVITASQSGTLLSKEVEVGTYLQPGMRLMDIGDTESLYMESDILVSEIGKIKEGATVLVSHDDLGIDGKGVVRKIYPKAFSKVSDLGIEQKRIKVQIDIKESLPRLRPGYDMDIKIVVNRKEDTWLVPENAVFQDEGKDYVFVVENNRALLREIRKGLESDKLIEVMEGLKEGEAVILSPEDDLEEGMAVNKM